MQLFLQLFFCPVFQKEELSHAFLFSNEVREIYFFFTLLFLFLCVLKCRFGGVFSDLRHPCLVMSV